MHNSVTMKSLSSAKRVKYVPSMLVEKQKGKEGSGKGFSLQELRASDAEIK